MLLILLFFLIYAEYMICACAPILHPFLELSSCHNLHILLVLVAACIVELGHTVEPPVIHTVTPIVPIGWSGVPGGKNAKPLEVDIICTCVAPAHHCSDSSKWELVFIFFILFTIFEIISKCQKMEQFSCLLEYQHSVFWVKMCGNIYIIIHMIKTWIKLVI